MPTSLSLNKLCKQFGGIVVADSISLEVKAGEILGLIGPNGAGKTSLFNLISGIYSSDSGEIVVGGRCVTGLPTYHRARLGVARTWQHMRLFSTMTVLENMLVAPRHYPGEQVSQIIFRPLRTAAVLRELRERAMSILQRMKIESIWDASVNDIPFGQQKLVGLARALMNGGDYLLLDEPMAGVEGSAYETIKAIVRDEASAGKVVCVVEHNVSFIRDLCNSAVFMANGKILERGNIESLLSSKALTELYFGA